MFNLNRKRQHIKYALKLKNIKYTKDSRFYYEPLFSSHINKLPNYFFLGEKIGAPLFISSITGGDKISLKINKRLLQASQKYNIPLGLGSIRPFIENRDTRGYLFKDINISNRNLIWGNIGIAQLEEMETEKSINKLTDTLNSLNIPGLIIHINPLQEWVQPGGDRYKKPVIETLEEILPKLNNKIIVKEVGTGFGPESLKQLYKLKIDAIETSGFGGTNFTHIEYLRNSNKYLKKSYKPLINIGNTNDEMIEVINKFDSKNKEIIISGGINNYLDGFYYLNKLKTKAIYGYAGKFLNAALKSQKALDLLIETEINGLKFANNFLKIK